MDQTPCPSPIGTDTTRPDAWTKVCGRETYAADFYAPDMVWAGLKRAQLPHAKITSLDTAQARLLPGVLAVLTAEDVPGSNATGLIHKDQPILVQDIIRRQGDPVALVVAETQKALDQALKSIDLELEELPGVYDPQAALADGASLVHAHAADNVMAEITARKGDGAKDFDRYPLCIEHTVTLPRQEHAFLETEAGWARQDHDGRIILTVSTQSPHRDRLELSEALEINFQDLRIMAPFLGGGFGGKDGLNVHPYLVLAARQAHGRPVKMHWPRSESFLAGTKRMPGTLIYRLGAEEDGRLAALDCRILLDGGAYSHLNGEVLSMCVEHAGGPYRIPHVHIHGRCVYTNNPPGGPFRGFGAPQAAAGMEQCMDILARRLDMDPVHLRRINVLHKGEKAPLGNTLTHSTGLDACLDKADEHPLWRERNTWREQAGRFKRRGVGLSCVWHGMGYGPQVADYATAKIELTDQGAFRVAVGVADMGQGNAGTFARIVAEILNQDSGSVQLVLPDTDLTPPCCSAAASRTTYTYGRALIDAARSMHKRLQEKAAVMSLGGRPRDFVLIPGGIRDLRTGREMPLSALSKKLIPEERVSLSFWQAPQPPDVLNLKVQNALGLPHSVFSHAVHVAFVEVDELTGQVRVLNYLAVTEAGQLINPQLFHQQIQGGVAQGLGYALFEDYAVQNGHTRCPGFGAYVLPMSMDIPDICSQAVQIHEDSGPFGMKGVGEIPVDAVLPAVANALADACGVRPDRPPFTPERVLSALNDNLVSSFQP
ncbi:MAG: xanthine dehydrogenase family protein molybdopterin-binding subunit [Desulfovermiculus sp.]